MSTFLSRSKSKTSSSTAMPRLLPRLHRALAVFLSCKSASSFPSSHQAPAMKEKPEAPKLLASSMASNRRS